ncbi:hypothetical protein AHAS_Ahas16G0048800 [Arachis hypogaea]
MALSKLLLASLLASLLIIQLVHADHQAYQQTQGSLQQIDCSGACAARCRLSSRPNLCRRACGTCCQRCNCVPPGTAGNQEIVIVNARGGVHYHQGRTYVRELAALAVTAAIVCRRALPATTRSALVMPIKPPMAAYTNVLKL